MKPIRSHKLRLALVSTAVAALVMGSVFTVVVSLVGRAVMHEERDEIMQAFRTVTNLGKPTFSMVELGEAGPALRARVSGPNGDVLASRGKMPSIPPDLRLGFETREHWLFFQGRYRDETVLVARDLAEVERGETELGTVLGLLCLPLSMLVGGATWLAALSIFRPLDRLAEAAAGIEGADLAQRLPAPDRAEFGALATVLNRMLSRIEESGRRSEQFAADAAHEMRTPLAVIRAQIETTLLRSRTTEEYVASNRAVLGEAERLSTLLDALLCSARGKPEAAPIIPLASIVRDAASRTALPGLRLDIEEAAGSATAQEIGIVVGNLLDNARRFAPAGSVVLLSLRSQGAWAVLQVVDHGPGVPGEQADQIFERLYRTDEGRNRASGGAGIGLAVCRRLVESRGGTIQVEPTPGGGSTFVVRWLSTAVPVA